MFRQANRERRMQRMIIALLMASSTGWPVYASGAGATCEVKGGVTAMIDGTRIPAAKLIFIPKLKDSKSSIVTTTNQEGHYQIEVPSGGYHLQVLASGFRRYEKDVNVACAKDNALEIDVEVEVGIRAIHDS